MGRTFLPVAAQKWGTRPRAAGAEELLPSTRRHIQGALEVLCAQFCGQVPDGRRRGSAGLRALGGRRGQDQGIQG